MENRFSTAVNVPWYCKPVFFTAIIVGIILIDFLTYYSVMDVIFQNTDRTQGMILSVGIVAMIDLPPMVLADMIPIKKKTIQILMCTTMFAIVLLMLASIVQRLCSADLVFSDVMLSGTTASLPAQRMSMVLLSLLPIATSVFSFALSAKKKMVSAHLLLEETQKEIILQKAKKSELEDTLLFDQFQHENRKYEEAVQRLLQKGETMKSTARYELSKYLGEKKAISKICSEKAADQSPLTPEAKSEQKEVIDIPETQTPFPADPIQISNYSNTEAVSPL